MEYTSTKTIKENYNNCKIILLNPHASEGQQIFKIKHNASNEQLHAISKSEAYKITRLLDLSYHCWRLS